ncbi:MAG TPA: nucleotidyl transferase AbiEii/AbiGii toxin family protein [Thermoanaerobaculia bacterium]|jgi:predicted nucleotidyltransferase component of viral defense system|nr:nucleotidyl transferase AbiEii/AbiGii toxin family protein [Thermoanaerobaculia bacterium]
MIAKQDILDRAQEWLLQASVVEKDYVLGWVLAAIAQHQETSEQWVFKGGTCLKKCYFETYRFSEDLDFSLLPDAAYDAEALTQTFREIVEIAHELSGITFPAELVSVKARVDKLGRGTFEGKIGYSGPLGFTRSLPRLLFDLTRNEPVLAEPELRPVFHPYPDSLPDGTAVPAYSIEELFAEKTRALFERTRPRDLYDVVFILESRVGDVDLDEARDFFRRKCEAKDLQPPSSDQLLDVARSSGELRSEWENMLAHQLPQLPPFEDHLVRLESVLRWIDAPRAATPLMASFAAKEELVAPSGVTYWNVGVPLEVARFAGINRLLVEFTYHGKPRLAAPYSLRRASNGNLLLYAWEVDSPHIKAFSVREITGLRVTTTPFTPQYRVEFSSIGGIAAPMIARTSSRRGRSDSRPLYVFRCGSCEKLFRHATNDSSLRAHKTPEGWRCTSRRGYLERVD